jgi:2,3-dihydroxybenzoate-AMP ligase
MTPIVQKEGSAMLDGCVPFPPETAETYRRLGYWHGKTLGAFVQEWARQYGERVALVSGGEQISYRELAERSDRLALALLRLGIAPKDRVVVQLPNVPDFVFLVVALFRIGALPVLALPAHREYEISHLIEHAQATAYAIPAAFGAFDYQELARAVRTQRPSLRHLLVSGKSVAPDLTSLDDLMQQEQSSPAEAAAQLDRLQPDPAEVAVFLLSGGTTGRPKLIPRTHDDYAYNVRTSAEVCGFGPQTNYLISLPIGHNFPFACPGLLGTLHNGGKVVLTTTTDPEQVFALIERERITVTALVPALAIRWLDAQARPRYDLSSLQLLQVGGARLNPEAAQRVQPLLGCQLQQVYGMAEGLLNYTRLDDPEEVIIGSQGRPMSPGDEFRIVDDHDQPVAPGEMGELLTRGPYTIRGYYHVPAINAQSFTADGFYRSGDMVRLLSSGNFVVEGRKKDLINRGGEKISAEEIENLILAHPHVLNVAVVAIPDAVLGERACACVITLDEQRVTLGELVAFLETRKVARFKLPERLELLSAFPLTSVGKINKTALREQMAQKLAAEVRGNVPKTP